MPDLLSTSTSGLLAFQRTLATISHNVANANTEGYSRQRVELASRLGQNLGYGYVGSGVKVEDITRLTDSFTYSRALDSKSELARLTQISALAGRIDITLSNRATGLAQPWSNFFDGAQAVSTQPASSAAREQFLAEARTLVNRFRSLDSEFKTQELEVNARLENSVNQANDLALRIAELNKQIAGLGRTGAEPNDLLDQRERLVGELATFTGALVQMQDDGAMNVFTPSGQSLVIGGTASRLTIINDPYRPERRDVAIDSGGGSIRLPSGSIAGQIGGLMEFRSSVLDPSSIALGRMAAALAFEFNAQHRAGMDFYGDLGGDFFTQPVPGVREHSANTGAASFTGSVVDPSALDGRDIVLTFDGAVWNATDAVSGSALAMTGTGTVADPFLVGGTSLVVSGAAAAGDRFLVQPTAGAGGRIGLAVTDPNRIAAASPVRGSADLGNLGNGQITGLQVTDASDVNLLTTVDIDFIDANTYTINAGPPIAYTAGDVISANGWSFTLDGTPQAGDRFTIQSNIAGSSDNGNARLFATLDDAKLLTGGTQSLNDALQGLTTQVGTSARSTDQALEAQRVLDQQISNERDGVSGVNLDEEAANMLRYQQAYQAAAQMIGVADTVFQSLLAAVQR